MTGPDVLTELRTCRWDAPVEGDGGAGAEAALESGRILFFPKLPFALSPEERPLLSETSSDGRSKNVAFDVRSGRLHGTLLTGAARERLQAMMRRFASSAARLVKALLAPRFVDCIAVPGALRGWLLEALHVTRAGARPTTT